MIIIYKYNLMNHQNYFLIKLMILNNDDLLFNLLIYLIHEKLINNRKDLILIYSNDEFILLNHLFHYLLIHFLLNLNVMNIEIFMFILYN